MNDKIVVFVATKHGLRNLPKGKTDLLKQPVLC